MASDCASIIPELSGLQLGYAHETVNSYRGLAAFCVSYVTLPNVIFSVY